MPARHAKWFILGAVAVVILLAAWGVKSFLFPGSGDPGNSTNVAAGGKKDAESSGSSEEDASSEAAAPPVEKDAEEEAEGEGPASLLEGLASAKDAQDAPGEPEAAVEEKPEKIEIKVSVTPAKAAVYMDGKRAKKPYKFSMEKSQESHTLKVEMKGYEPYESTFTAEESREIEVALAEIPPPEPEEKPVAEETTSKPAEKPEKKKGGKKGKKGKKGTGLVEDVPF